VDGEGVCVPPLQPPGNEEICNGLDDDCDGLIDEHPTLPGQKLTNGECWWPNIDTSSPGQCQPGVLRCFGAGGLANWICQGATGPQTEQCNGLDENCNGSVDENVFEACGGCDPALYPGFDCLLGPIAGRCRQGTRQCQPEGSGTWLACLGDLGPTAELCNAIDDDCDGLTDNGVSPATDSRLGQPCPGKVGACAGLTVCNVGEVVCDNDLQPGTNVETCNNTDDDCDGYIDEGLIETCGGANPFGCDPNFFPMGACPDGRNQGLCRAGVRTCQAGEWSECQGSVEAECAWNGTCDVCDGVDNDCDGRTDENYSSSGTCGPCANGTYVCLNGIEQCSGGTVPTPEVCDGVDNNCDGQTDEGLMQACGGCVGAGCTGNPSEGTCQTGIQYCNSALSSPGNPVYGSCQGNTNPIPEICDGLDNDCDGQTDEGLAAPAGVCNANCPGVKTPVCIGAAGWRCTYDCGTNPGQVECDGQGNPMPVETLCDGFDNNCDGDTDEPFDIDFDASNCGACGNDCSSVGGLWPQGYVPPHIQQYGCVGGTCVIISCQDQYWDSSSSAHADCDVGPCTQSNGGVETCDGIDNDCDGQTDENVGGVEVCNGIDDDCDSQTDEDLTLPPGACKNLGECSGISNVAACNGATSSWNCNYNMLNAAPYNRTIQLSGGVPVAEESLCDGKDNDCDGWTDEAFPTLGQACDNGGIGACYASGVYRCSSALTGTVCCSTSNPGAVCQGGNVVGPITPGPVELCDGIDNTCDGQTDVGAVVDQYLTVSGTGWSFDIFAHEASRPDAAVYDGTNWTATGVKSTAACSKPSRIPWSMVTNDEAEAACWRLNPSGTYEAGGWELCSAKQWQHACQYGSGVSTAYPYGNSYVATTCNGHDFSSGWDRPVGTGTASACYAEWGTTDIWDMSGNMEEWTNTTRVVGSDTLYEIRGGSYNDLAGSMTCNFDFWAAEEDFRMPNLGFRCCRGDDPVSSCIAQAAGYSYTFEGSPCNSTGWSFTTAGRWAIGNDSTPAPYQGSCQLGMVLGGSYGNSWNEYATSPAMNLGGCVGQKVTMNWRMWIRTEQYYDWVYVEAYDGSAWKYVAGPYQGIAASWNAYSADVSPHVNAGFRIRFRFMSDGSTIERGPYIDNISFTMN
jgi:hypothetical protein